MSQKEQVLVALHEFEQAMRQAGAVSVVIVGLPSTQEFVRMSNGMKDADNRTAFSNAFADYMQKHAEGRAT